MNPEPTTRPPLVTIIIPCFKHAKYLPEAIDSALAQTHPHVEIIVVNDGSPDETAEVCGRYQGRIRYIEQANQGLATARNAGIRAATGDYIVPLDADDKLAPTFIAATLPFIEHTPQTGYVYTDVREFGGYHSEQEAVSTGKRVWDVTRLLIYNISVCTALFRKSDWERVGGYCPQFVHGGEDWDFWLSMVERGMVGHYVPEALFFYRRHASGSMWSGMMSRKSAESYALLINRHRHLFEQYWQELLVEWAKRYQESFAYILKVEPLLEEYYHQRPGRMEKYGVPLPIARLLRRLARR